MLYAEFVNEAAERLADAWVHVAENPDVLAGLVSLVRRMRLTSSSDVIAAAGLVVRQVMDAHAAPNRRMFR